MCNTRSNDFLQSMKTNPLSVKKLMKNLILRTLRQLYAVFEIIILIRWVTAPTKVENLQFEFFLQFLKFLSCSISSTLHCLHSFRRCSSLTIYIYIVEFLCPLQHSLITNSSSCLGPKKGLHSKLGNFYKKNPWGLPRSWRQSGGGGERARVMAATEPAAKPGGGADSPRVGLIGGLFSAREWEEIRARSKRILHGAADRRSCLEISRRRASEFFGKLEGGIPFIPSGGGLTQSVDKLFMCILFEIGSKSSLCPCHLKNLRTKL